MNERFFHGTMIVAALAFMGVSAVGLQATRIVLQPNQYVSKIAWSLVLLSGAAFYRWRNAEKAVNLETVARLPGPIRDLAREIPGNMALDLVG